MSHTAVITRPEVRPVRGSLPSRRTVRPATRRADGVRWAVGASVLVTATLFWSADSGGYGTVVWLPSTIVLIAVAVWLRLVCGPARPLGRLGRCASVALVLYVAWSFLSITWAVDRGTALLGSDRALLYLVLYAFAQQLRWDLRRLQLAELVYLAGVGVIAVITLVDLATGSGAALLQNGELAFPTGYHNSTAALGTMGTVMGIVLLSSADLRPWVRAACSAMATVCLELSLFSASRGWLYTLPVVVLLSVAVAPRRARLLLWSLLCALPAAATLPWLLHAQSVGAHASGLAGERLVAHADSPAAAAGLLATLLAAAVAYLLACAEEQFALGPAGRRLARSLTIVTAIGTGALVLSAVIVAVFDGAIARGWHQFTTDAPVRAGESRFIQLGSGRYDFWRVALDDFIAHPLGGLGQDNFAQSYTVMRHTTEEPAWVHSLELRLLASTGAVGLALFVTFLIFAVWAVLGLRRSLRGSWALVLAAAVAPLIVWTVHGSIDWFWEFPALSGPVFVFLGAAVALTSGSGAVKPAPEATPLPSSQALVPFRAPRLPQRLARSAEHRRNELWLLAGGVALVAAAVALIPACLGEFELQHARTVSASAPGAALSDLRTAAALEPLSDTPQLISSALLLNAADDDAALGQARAGLRRDPDSWLLWLEAGLAAGHRGHADLERAHALDPREPVITAAIRRAGGPHPLTIREAATTFAERGEALIGR